MGRTRIVSKDDLLDTGNSQPVLEDAIRATDQTNIQIAEQVETKRELKRLNDQMENITDNEVIDPTDK